MGLKGKVAGYDLEQCYLLFRFMEVEERDLILDQPWMVISQVLVVEPWRSGFFLSEGAIRLILIWV